MKKTIYILAIIGLMFGACDKIEAPYLEEVGSTGGGPGPVEKARKILLEEFTGHICVNCPEATLWAQDLKAIYGEQLILLSMHAGSLSVPFSSPYDADYRTQTGTSIFNFYDPVGVPIGLVNRTPYNGNTLMFSGDWEGAVQELIDVPADAYIEIENEYYEASRKLDIHVHTEFLHALSGSYNLCVMLIESGMVSAQKNDLASIGDTPNWLDYEHQHVLRKGVNGTWGEFLVNDPSSDMLLHTELSVTLDSDWDVANMAIIAFVLDSETYEVIQAEEIHIL